VLLWKRLINSICLHWFIIDSELIQNLETEEGEINIPESSSQIVNVEARESPMGESQSREMQAGKSQTNELNATVSQAFNRIQKSAKVTRWGKHRYRYSFSCNNVQELRHFIYAKLLLFLRPWKVGYAADECKGGFC